MCYQLGMHDRHIRKMICIYFMLNYIQENKLRDERYDAAKTYKNKTCKILHYEVTNWLFQFRALLIHRTLLRGFGCINSIKKTAVHGYHAYIIQFGFLFKERPCYQSHRALILH